MTINNKVNFFIGTSGRWGFEFSYDQYERSLTILFIHWYMGVEVWYSE